MPRCANATCDFGDFWTFTPWKLTYDANLTTLQVFDIESSPWNRAHFQYATKQLYWLKSKITFLKCNQTEAEIGPFFKWCKHKQYLAHDKFFCLFQSIHAVAENQKEETDSSEDSSGIQYKCLWEGCKVYGKGSSSKLWLEKHVMSHGGNKPFQCIVDGCKHRFGTQVRNNQCITFGCGHLRNLFGEQIWFRVVQKKLLDNMVK